MGDSALAALIGKSGDVSVEEEDEIVITIGTRSVSDRHRTGTKTEFGPL